MKWASGADGRAAPAQVNVEMVFRSRADMLELISQVVSAEGSKILGCQLRTDHEETGFAAITIAVRDAPQFGRILTRLKSLSGMIQVERRRVATRVGP